MRFVLLTALIVLAGCCSLKSFEDMRSRAETAEHELAEAREWLNGKDQDNAALQTYCVKLEAEIMLWQHGSILQARREAELRKGCDI